MKKTNKAQKADKKVGKLEGQIKVMRLRKHNKIQYYNSSDSESDGESMPHKKRGATKMTKSRNSKKETENAHYKKGEFNSKIKEIPKQCVQLEGKQQADFKCCVRCSNKELIRAVQIQDFGLFSKILKSKNISHPLQRWSPDNNFSMMHLIFAQSNKKFLEHFLKFLNEKPKFKKETPFALKHIETGHNNKYAYGSEVRDVQVGRKGKLGNNAFVDDVYLEQYFSKALMEELVLTDCDVKMFQYLTTTLKKFQVDRLYSSIQIAVRAGNYKLAGFLISQIKTNSQYGFNEVHSMVLNQKTPQGLSEFRKASFTKKNTGRNIVTPIHCAAINPNPKILELLLELSQEYSIQDDKLRKPIHYAAACQSSGTVELLKSKGVDIREGDVKKFTPLMIAAQFGRLHNLPLLANEETINLKNREGNAALHLAAMHGHLDCVKYLLNNGANIEMTGQNRCTAINWAAMKGHFEIVKYLHEQKAKINTRDKYGRSAVLLAARNGNARVLAYLLRNGGDYNQGDTSQNSPLHYVAAYGFRECLDLLIQAGADQNAKNSWSLTPLSVALQKNHNEIVKMLLALKDTDVNCKDDKGRSLIINEIRRSEWNEQYLKMLVVEKQALVNQCDLLGDSPLHHASRKSIDIVKFLIANGGNVNLCNKNGDTPFITAVKKAKYDIAYEILKCKNFRTDLKNTKGQTVLQQVIESNCFFDYDEGCKLIEHLIKQMSQSDLESVDSKGYNARQQLIIKFVTGISAFYDIELRQQITELLQEQFNSGKINEEMNEENSQMEEEVNDDDEEDVEIANEDHDDEDNEDNEEDHHNSDQDDEEHSIQTKKKKGSKKQQMEEEDEENDNDNDEDEAENEDEDDDEKQNSDNEDEDNEQFEKWNEELLKEEDDDDTQEKEKIKTKYIEFYYEGELYYIKNRLENWPFSKYDSQKYVESYSVKVIKEKKEETVELTPTLKDVHKCEQEIIKESQQVENAVIKLFYLIPAICQTTSGLTLTQYIYAFYPKQSFYSQISPTLRDINDADSKTPLHYLGYHIQDSLVYDIDEFVNLHPVDPNLMDEHGNTAYSIMALRGVHFAHVNHLNKKNEVPLLKWIQEKKIPEELLNLADPNLCDRDGRNSLHHCLMARDFENLYYLLQKGVDHNKTDKFNRSPIFYAFINQNEFLDYTQEDPFEIVASVCREGTVDKYGRSILHYAAQRGSSMSARQLLSKGAKSNLVDNYGNTPLALAFLAMHLDACIMLIDNKDNIHQLVNVTDYQDIINEIDLDKNTKAQNKRKHNSDDEDEDEDEEEEEDKEDDDDGVSVQKAKNQTRNFGFRNRWRTAKKSKPKQEENEVRKYNPRIAIGKYSMFRMALINNWPQIEYLLMANGFPLYQAIEDCLKENRIQNVINLLMKADKSSDFKFNQDNQTILQIFAHSHIPRIGNKDNISNQDFDKIIKYISFLPIDHTDNRGRTALHYAARNGFRKLIEYLIKNKAQINQQDKEGSSPFSLFLQSDYVDLEQIQFWIDNGSSVHSQFSVDGKITAPLIYLVREKRITETKIIDLLIKHGCDVNHQDHLGSTLLITLIQLNNTDLVKHILKYVKHSIQIDHNRRNPLHHLVKPLPFGSYENVELLKLLIEHYDKEQKDAFGKSAVEYAAEYESSKLYDILQPGKKTQNLPRRTQTKESAWTDVEIDYLHDSAEYVKTKNKKTLIKVDEVAAEEIKNTELHENYTLLMTKVDIGNGYYSQNVFYKMQILHEYNQDFYILFTRWGRIGSTGQYQHTAYQNLDECIKEFKKIFKSKSGNEWGTPFQDQPKGYHLLNQKNYKNLDKFLKPFSSKIQMNIENPIQTFCDLALYKKGLNDLNLEEDSLESLAREDLLRAEVHLGEIEELIKKLDSLRKAQTLNLEEIQKVTTELCILSNRYYETVPYIDASSIDIEIIDNFDLLNENIKQVKTLLNFEITSKLLLGALYKQESMNPYEYILKAMNVHLTKLNPDQSEFLMIQALAKNHKIQNIFCVERKGEIQKFKRLSNRMLLWHGSKVSNYMGILAQGLKIAPPWVSDNGALFGKGIYFADQIDKSINYTDSAHGSRYLLLCEVALGKMLEVEKIDKFKGQQTYQSVKGCGRFEKDMNQCVIQVNGCKVPLGELLPEKKKNTLQHSEYVVYSEEQVRIRYLVEIK